MSDQYLTLLTSGITAKAELASKLSISEEGYNRVAENPSFPDDKTKVMKVNRNVRSQYTKRKK